MSDGLMSYLLADSLSWGEYICFIVFDCFILVVLLLFMKYKIFDSQPTTTEDETKRRRTQLAWILSCLNGLLTSIMSIIYIYIRCNRQGQLLSTISFQLVVEPSAAEMLLGRDNMSIIMITHLAVNNIIDLLFGSIYYSEHLDIGTGWIHHIFYVVMIRACITGDAIIFRIAPFTKGLGILLLLEIPTFILALGRILPKYRSDLCFGITFFSFRILFHGYFILCTVLSNMSIDPGHYFFLISTFIIHCYWFFNWFRRYGIRLFNRKIRNE